LPLEALLKHISSILAITLLLGAGALGFTSCASNEIKNPETPVAALKSEPDSAADSNELAPSVSIAPQKAQKYSAKPLTNSYTASPVQPLSAAPVVMVSAPAKTGNTFWDSGWWPWLLLLIALLLVLKATQTLWARNRKKEMAAELALAQETGLTDEGILVQGGGKAPMVLAAKKARWAPVLNLSKSAVKEIAVTAFFNGKEHKMHFSPATTVKKVTAWAAYQCEIFDLNSTEVYLAIRGYSAPLIGTAHIGRFVLHGKHHLELDVVTFAKNIPAVPETLLAKTPLLAKDEIWVEGAGMTQIVPVAVKPNAPLQEVISSVARIGNFPPQDAFIFLENESNPLNPNLPLDANHPRHRIHHVHTQKEIAVTVFYNGKEHQMHFSPATTVKKVNAWADYQCEIFDQDAAEAYLAIHGYSAPLPSAAHIGRFVMHDQKHLELDLLTFTKVNV
jgi:hypothetical protein